MLRRKGGWSREEQGTTVQPVSRSLPPRPSWAPSDSPLLFWGALLLASTLTIFTVTIQRLQKAIAEEDGLKWRDGELLSVSTTHTGMPHIRPSQVFYDSELNAVEWIKASEVLFPEEKEDVETVEIAAPGWDPADPEPEEITLEGCHFQNRNHAGRYPTCSQIHEIDLMGISLINCGGARCAFTLPDGPGPSETVVLKLQKFKKEYKERRLEKARLDALIMEQATSSPYVANVFVACGTSQVLEYSSKGSLHDLVKISRLAEQDPMKPLDKLKVLIHIASALADLHDKGAVHGDLCIDQFLFLDGVYKLNDFHMSLFVQQQDDNDQICFERNHFSSGNYLYHAPEEKDKAATDLYKADVFMMGNVMFNVYAKSWLYEGVKEEEALTMLYAGKHSQFPTNLDTATIPANRAMQSAILKCWTNNPQERPSAKAIRDFLRKELSTIVGRSIHPGNDATLRVQVPPLPKDHRYTGHSMDHANDEEKKPKQLQFNTVER